MLGLLQTKQWVGPLVWAAGAAIASGAATSDIAATVPLDLRADSLPSQVDGLMRRGSAVRTISVTLKNRSGALRDEARPAVAILESAAWSPEDAPRDGASAFEVLMCAARLLDRNALAGIVGVGNRSGAFLPSAEQAFRRVVPMGIPVVRLARDPRAAGMAGELFIEGGTLSPEEARRVLAECLLRHGALPPAADPLNPTPSEIAAIKHKLAIYQAEFNLRSAKATQVALR